MPNDPDRSTYRGWSEAFAIFAKYVSGRGNVAAEYDEVYAGPDPDVVSAEDMVRLEALGWHADSEHDCFNKWCT